MPERTHVVLTSVCGCCTSSSSVTWPLQVLVSFVYFLLKKCLIKNCQKKKKKNCHTCGTAEIAPLKASVTSMKFSSVASNSFVTPWTAACQASLSITNSQSLHKLISIEWVMPSNHLIMSSPSFFSCFQSFLASGSFQMSQFFTSSNQTTGVSASASVLPMNI